MPGQRSTILTNIPTSVDAAAVEEWSQTGPSESLPSKGSSVRVIRTLEEMEEIRLAWAGWRGHRDADIDVCETLLRCSTETTKPHIILIERNKRPDAMLVGTVSTTTLSESIAYIKLPISRVRVLNFMYGGFLGNQSEDNCKLVVKEIEQSLKRGDADVAILSYVRENTPLHQIATNIRSVLMRGHFPDRHSHWIMDVPQATDGIYTAISREHRASQKEESRKFRKFKAAFPDLEMVRFEGTERLEQLFTDAERVAATTYQRGLGVGFADTQPIRDLLTLEARKGWLRGHVLYAGGRPCAFEIGCLYNHIFFGDYLGHDPAFAKYAPGTYLLVQVIEALGQEKVATIDWGIGDALYKRRFGNQHWNESTVCLYAPTFKGMQAKVLRMIAGLVNVAGKRALRGTNWAARLKKLWRNRLAAGS